MKKFIPSVLLLLLLIVSSCQSSWDEDTRQMFHQSCMDEAKGLASSPEQAKTYCDCVLETTMKKYPKVSDALENSASIGQDPEIQKCKEQLGK